MAQTTSTEQQVSLNPTTFLLSYRFALQPDYFNNEDPVVFLTNFFSEFGTVENVDSLAFTQATETAPVTVMNNTFVNTVYVHMSNFNLLNVRGSLRERWSESVHNVLSCHKGVNQLPKRMRFRLSTVRDQPDTWDWDHVRVEVPSELTENDQVEHGTTQELTQSQRPRQPRQQGSPQGLQQGSRRGEHSLGQYAPQVRETFDRTRSGQPRQTRRR